MARPPTAYSSRFLGDLDHEPVETGPDRYLLRGELGRGGMGRVTLASDRVLSRDVALKRPHPDLPEQVRQQVIREASLTARLPHPGIAPVLDAGDDEEGFYYTMPVLVGQTLGAVARDPRDVVRALVRACDALGFAHARGVVHRDIKPDNLLLGEHGEVWVLDWGVALDPQDERHGSVGTRGFAAPEQERGEKVGPPADVFSLGRTLAACIEPLPPELASVVDRATAADPAARYPSATALGRELDAWLKGQQVQAHAYRADQLLRRWVRRRRLPLAVASFGLAAVGATAAWGFAAQLEEFARAETALARSLAVRSRAERTAGHRAEAEWLASEALLHGESPDARGVLSAWHGIGRPRHRGSWTPPCDGELQPHAWLCVSADAVEAWWDGERLQRLVLAPPTPGTTPERVTYTPEEGVVVQWGLEELQTAAGRRPLPEGAALGSLLAGPYGFRSHGQQPLYARTATDHVPLARCELRPEAWDVRSDGRFALGCGEGTVLAGSEGAVERLELDGYPSAVRVHGDRVLIGTQDGRYTVWTPGRPLPAPRTTGCGAPVQLEVLDGLGIGRTERGEVFTFDLDGLALLDRLPGRFQRIATANETLLTASGTVIERWSPGERVPVTHDLRRHGGVTTFDVSPDGRALLVGGPDGSIVHVDTATGQQRTLVTSAPFAVKLALFLGDGRFVTHDGDTARFHAPDGSTETVRLFVWNRARTSFRGKLWVANNEVAYSPDGERVEGHFPSLTRGSDGAYGLTSSGTLVDLAQPTKRVELGVGVRLVAVQDRRLYTVASDGLVARDRAGEPIWTVPLQGEASAIAADAEHVAVGTLEGGLAVFDTAGRLRAQVPDAHERRVVELYLVDGVLWTGSWDGTVRRWDLGALEVPAAELQAALQQEQQLTPL